MKKIMPGVLILMLLFLVSCRNTDPDVISCYADTSDISESINSSEIRETDEPESGDTGPTESADNTEEPEEVVIVLGDEPTETEPASETLYEAPMLAEESAGSEDIVIMKIPGDYTDIHRALKDSEWFGVSYDEAVKLEIVETGAPIDVPEAEIVYDTAVSVPMESESGKVYNAEEMFSQTNTQLADIDEGDIVKTDGENIYILKDSEELVILAAEGKGTQLLSRTTVAVDEEYCDWDEGGYVTLGELENEQVKELYISGDRLGIVRTYYNWYRWTDKDENRTYIDIYDVSDPTDPAFVTTLGQDGTYFASRMIGDTVWLITQHGVSIKDIADSLDTESYIPGLFTKDTQTLIPEENIVYPENITWKRYTVITSCDLSSGTRMDSKALLGIPVDNVYMNGSHIYLAKSQQYTEESEPYSEGMFTAVDSTTGQRTSIVKLDITDGIRTEAMTVLPGRLLNQFSMDEYNGYLRVVTTLNQESYKLYKEDWISLWMNGFSTNALYILDGDLNITGMIEDIAPDERVKSVRFMGNTGYFVTFRQVDPLFSVDLSNPESPEILSELKIPGFSQYLHPWDDGLLLGLGQDADENTGRTTGLKLSMFDISDPCDVTEQHKLKLNYGWSEALNSHRAILVSKSRNLIGFQADNGYVVYGYDPSSGFFERAYIEMDGYWSSFSRGLFVNDELYILLDKGCTVLDLNDFTVLAAVPY